MSGIPTPTRRLHLHFLQRPRRAGGGVRRRQRREPEVRQLGPKSFGLFSFDLQQGCLLGFSCKSLYRALIKLEFTLRASTCAQPSAEEPKIHRV
jgi:hypothetical protein